MSDFQNPLNRRRFLTAASAGPLIVRPAIAFGSQANSAVEIGIVGCGGRGTWIGDLFQEFGGARIVAFADVAQSRIDIIKTKLKSEQARTYVGFNSYKELAASNLDAVVIETPVYFHPQQAAAGVAAGKHVYMAKPLAVDVPGTHSIVESGRQAMGKKSFWIDFQYRSRTIFQDCIARVRSGDLGTPVMAHVWYHSGKLPVNHVAGETPAQDRIRNWFFDKALSGDIIVEQNIHSIDAMCWLLDQHPLKATGVAGRKERLDGDTSDHYIVTYTFGGDLLADFSSTQSIKGYSSIMARLYGSKGTAEMEYGKTAFIKGEKPWAGPEKDDTFRGGAIDNIRAFVTSIRDGKPINNAEQGARSNLTAILGRTAAYHHATVTWDEMLRANEKIDAGLEG